jgi:hypothetical protein
MDQSQSQLEESDSIGDLRLHSDWSWPFGGDQSNQSNWFSLKQTENSLNAWNQAVAPLATHAAEVQLRFDWVTEETLTDPAHEKWRVSSRTASATHWRGFVFFRAYAYAALVSFAALFFIASFVQNMSAENTEAWTISVIGATAIKLFVVDPFKVFIMSVVLQCVEAWPVTARVVEGHIVTKSSTPNTSAGSESARWWTAGTRALQTWRQPA